MSKAKLKKILDNLGNISVLSDYNDLLPIQKKIFTRYDDAIIVFDFQLRMTEANKAAAGTSIVRPFIGGADVFGFKASNNLERQNYRTFRITTTVREIMSDRCEADQIRAPNYEYPIAGKVGLKEVFGTYFEIEYNNKLAKIGDWDDPALVDTLKFTTEIGGEFNPGFTATASGTSLQAKEFTGMFSSSRKDEHQLIVGIMLGPELPPPTTLSNRELRNTEVNQAKIRVNVAVDRQINKFINFGLNPLDPLGPLRN